MKVICTHAKLCGRQECPHREPHEKNWGGCNLAMCSEVHNMVECREVASESVEEDDYRKALSLAALLAPALKPNEGGLYATASGAKSLVGLYRLIRDEVMKEGGEG